MTVRAIPQHVARTIVRKLRPQFQSNLSMGCALHTGAVVSRIDAIPPIWIIKGSTQQLQDTALLTNVKL